MTATRADLRAALNHKLLALEDGGYGDFAYEDADFNMFLEMSVSRMFPEIYNRGTEVLTVTDYGTRGLRSCTPTLPADLNQVYRVEDAAERMPITKWSPSGSDIIGIDPGQLSGYADITTVTVFFYLPFTLPNDDVTPSGIPDVYKPLIILGALIEALESRQDVGVRGDPNPQGQFVEVQLLTRLYPRYDTLKKQLQMGLPGVVL